MSEAYLQSQITRKLRDLGAIVVKVDTRGNRGYPDLVVSYMPLGGKRGWTIWMEVKQPGKKPTRLQLTRHEQLQAMGLPVYVVHSVEEAVDCLC